MYDDTWRLFGCRLDKDREDLGAKFYLPIYGLGIQDPFCVRTTGNGSCFFNSASRLLYGREDMAAELRVRMLHQAITCQEHYLEHNVLAMHFDTFVPHGTITTVPDYYALSSPSFNTVNAGFRTNQTVYRAEIVRMATRYGWAHCWSLHFLADVARRPIVSLYPSFGDESDKSGDDFGMMKDCMNRTIYPMYTEDHSREPMYILWTKYMPGAVGALIDHFVPVVP